MIEVLEWTKYFLDGLNAYSSLIIGVVGAAWVVWRFELKQERYPHIELSAAINFIGVHKNTWVVELVAYVKNKGAAQHRMDVFDFTP